MESERIGRRYALALYSLTVRDRIEDRVESELKMIRDSLKNNPEWEEILMDHSMPFSEKYRIIDEFSKTAGVHQYLQALLKILVEKGRLFAYADLVREYNKMWRRGRGEVEIVVTAAHPEVLEELKREIQGALGSLGRGSPVVRGNVDPSIIGGLRVRVGDMVYDGSIKEQLRRIRKDLLVEIDSVS